LVSKLLAAEVGCDGGLPGRLLEDWMLGFVETGDRLSLLIAVHARVVWTAAVARLVVVLRDVEQGVGLAAVFLR